MNVTREKYPARVTKNDDPKKVGRIKVTCAGLIGDHETELPGWIEPALDWGWFYVPDIGELVEIECAGNGSHNEDAAFQSFLENPDIRWGGVRFQSPEGGNPRPPNDLLTSTNYGKRRGFHTPNGHVLMFDDTAENQQITLTWSQAGAFSQFTIDKNGSMLMLDRKGNMALLDAQDGQEAIVLVGGGDTTAVPPVAGQTVVLDSAGIKLVDRFGNIVELKDGVIQILAGGNIAISTGENAGITIGGNATVNVIGDATVDAVSVTVVASTVDLQTPSGLLGIGADSPLVRWLEAQPWIDAHAHLTVFGPSGPASGGPLGPIPPPAASTTMLVK